VSGPPMARPIERVVVPLDAASEHRTAIETAARLAERAKAPLHGIFVEDEDLLRLASLPFARQFTLGAGAEPLTTEQIELHLQVAAERARKELFAAAKRHGVTCSFEIVRGASESGLTRGSEHDLVVAGALTRPIAGNFRLECRWWSSIEATPGPFLLARHAWGASGAVVMLLRDRSAASSRLLEAAAQIAQTADRTLTVICPPAVAGTGFETGAGFEKWVADRLADHPVRLQVEIAPAEPAALHQRIGELDCRCLAIAGGGAEASGDRLRELVERFGCDILLVCEPGPPGDGSPGDGSPEKLHRD
jgi:nucleotide-binding universal stress UspA family protein